MVPTVSLVTTFSIGSKYNTSESIPHAARQRDFFLISLQVCTSWPLHPFHPHRSGNHPPAFSSNTNHSFQQMTKIRTRGKGCTINSHHLFTGCGKEKPDGNFTFHWSGLLIPSHWVLAGPRWQPSSPPTLVSVTTLLAAASHLSTVLWGSKAITTPSRLPPARCWQVPDTQNDWWSYSTVTDVGRLGSASSCSFLASSSHTTVTVILIIKKSTF